MGEGSCLEDFTLHLSKPKYGHLGYNSNWNLQFLWWPHRYFSFISAASSQDRQGPERENCSASTTVLLSCDVQQPAEQQMDFA